MVNTGAPLGPFHQRPHDLASAGGMHAPSPSLDQSLPAGSAAALVVHG
jgi:hypothetical protein